MDTTKTVIGATALGLGGLAALYFAYYSFTNPINRTRPAQSFQGDTELELGSSGPGPSGTMSSNYSTTGGRKHKKSKHRKTKRKHK